MTKIGISPVKSKIAWGALWLVIFFVAVAWRVQNLDAFGLSNDEGVYLMWGRLVADGYPLYGQTYAVQPPLFLEALGLAFRLAGDTLAAGRWAILLGFAGLAATLSWPAHRAGGRPAAIAALVLLGVAPLIFTFSRLAMAEVPATALAVFSLVLLVVYVENRGKGRLAASGFVLGLSLVFKTLNPFVAAPAGALLLLFRSPQPHNHGVWRRLVSPHKQWRLLLADLLVWSICVCLPVAAVFIVYDSAAAYDQLVAFRGDLRAAIPGSWPETWSHFKLFIAGHWGFWLLAFGGIMSNKLSGLRELKGLNELSAVNSSNSPNSLNSRNSLNFIWIIWLGAGVAMLLWHTPLFAHHFLVLLPPLILLGAGFISDVIAMWRWNVGAPAIRIFFTLLIAVAALSVPSMVKANQDTASIVTGGREQEALKFLKSITNPADFVMGDSQLLIFMADRRTPPPLGDLALVGIKARRQTSERMIQLTQKYQSPAVVQWSLRLPWLPEYLEWVDDNYLARRVWDNDHTIYFVQRVITAEQLPNEQQVQLGDAVTLRGYQVDPVSVQPGQELALKIYWQIDTPLDKDYTIFTQLLDSHGALVAGQDDQPLGGHFPTSQWPAGEIVTDVVQLPLPDNLPPGEYTLVTGMYLLETLERLPVPGSPGDFVTLSTVQVE